MGKTEIAVYRNYRGTSQIHKDRLKIKRDKKPSALEMTAGFHHYLFNKFQRYRIKLYDILKICPHDTTGLTS